MSKYKDLEVWKKALTLVKEIYKITKLFPKEELFSLTSQLRRATISIPANIAEGAGRGSDKDFSRFLRIALGSLFEVETYIILSRELNYLNENNYENLLKAVDEIGRMINGLIRSFKLE